MLRLLTPGDRVLLVLLVLAVIFSYFLVDRIVGEGSEVLVEVRGSVVYRADLSEPAVFAVEGVQGKLEIEVMEGTVAVVKADCPNRICVRTGRRSRSGEVIVCVPNQVIVRISGEPHGIRAVTG